MKGEIKYISNDEYHSETEHLSASRMKLAIKSVKHFADPEKHKEKKAFDLGNAFEYLLTDKVKYYDTVVIIDESKRPNKSLNMSGKDNKIWKEKIVKENKGKLLIDAEEHEMLKKMVKACEENKVISKLIKKGQYQISIFWKDKNGLKVKTRPDLVIWIDEKTVIIIDIKTTQDASPDGFAKQSMEYDYPFQAIMQIMGLESLGVFVDTYYWLAVEKSARLPMAQIYEFTLPDQAPLKIGYDAISKKIMKYKETGHAPGYEDGCGNKYGVKALKISDYYKNKMRNI